MSVTAATVATTMTAMTNMTTATTGTMTVATTTATECGNTCQLHGSREFECINLYHDKVYKR